MINVYFNSFILLKKNKLGLNLNYQIIFNYCKQISSSKKLKTLENQQVISEQEWLAIAGQQQVTNQFYLDNLSNYYTPALSVYNSAPVAVQTQVKSLEDTITSLTGNLTELAFSVIKRIKQLASKISTNVSA